MFFALRIRRFGRLGVQAAVRGVVGIMRRGQGRQRGGIGEGAGREQPIRLVIHSQTRWDRHEGGERGIESGTEGMRLVERWN